jgi:hypothetical protein
VGRARTFARRAARGKHEGAVSVLLTLPMIAAMVAIVTTADSDLVRSALLLATGSR